MTLVSMPVLAFA